MSPAAIAPADAARRATRAIGGAATALVVAALAATVIYAVGAVMGRPLDTVEGEVLFEAERIRRGLPLYVDPTMGAFDYGPVPARYYVLYPPVWSWLLSHVPAYLAAPVARVFDVVAWFGLLAWIAARAAAGCRSTAAVGAAFVGGVYTLTLFAVTGRPDALAVLLAGLALERSVRKGRIDVPAGMMFALAPFVKPNVVGLAAGAFLVHVTVAVRAQWQGLEAGRGHRLAPLVAALGTASGMALALHVASGGAWVGHLLRSTAQPLSFPLWRDQVASRTTFLGAPFAFAAWCGWRRRAEPGVRLALGALGASVGWAVFALGKIGSAGNYCIEPALAALVLIAHAHVPPVRKRGALALAALALGQALWDGVASVRSSYEELVTRFPAEQRALSHARLACSAGAGDVILGDETGIELSLDGRIVATPFQMTHLARRDLYPTDLWIADVRRPEVVGVVMEDDLLERPLSEVSLEHDRFGPELRAVLRERFELAETNGDWRTYRLRGR